MTHLFRPHAKYWWMCADCGCGPDEPLKHHKTTTLEKYMTAHAEQCLVFNNTTQTRCRLENNHAGLCVFTPPTAAELLKTKLRATAEELNQRELPSTATLLRQAAHELEETERIKDGIQADSNRALDNMRLRDRQRDLAYRQRLQHLFDAISPEVGKALEHEGFTTATEYALQAIIEMKQKLSDANEEIERLERNG